MSEASLIISRGKPTKQSSDYLWTDRNTNVSSRASSYFAVDGNYIQDPNVWLCSQTNYEMGFWMVDLQMKYHVDRVVIYNRQDDHTDGLLGVKVELLSRTNEVLHECGVINTIAPVYTIVCNGFFGDQVRLQATKTSHITLCEVEVHRVVDNDPPIISKGKPTNQSTDSKWNNKETNIQSPTSSYYAVDGIYINDPNVWLCSQTDEEMGFWMVDLQNKFHIDLVVIHSNQVNHQDNLLGVAVELLSNKDEVLYLCAVIEKVQLIYHIKCSGEMGHKIRLRATKNTSLILCEVEVHQVIFSKNIISINKPTSQSSTLANWSSDLAVDGIYLQDGSKLTCSHTNNETGNYWMVDLKGTYKIYYILIYNRQDCCADRIVGVVVELMSKSNEVLYECGRINLVQSIYNVSCFATIGQKVRVRRINQNFIQLCEVEVHGEIYKNSIVSTKMPTSQSSTLSTGLSSLAVDGVYLQNVDNKSCSRTNKEVGYWMVNLGSNYNIDRVVIYNRQDENCMDEIVGVAVEVLSKENKVLFECGKINDVKSVYTFPCFASNGWKVRIRRSTINFLTLCEVDVHGVKSDASSIISKGKMTGQSSIFVWTNKLPPNYGFSAYAVDGKYTQDANEGSCSMTNEEKSFWIVDLDKAYNIDYILIYNRQDCCTDRLLGVKVELLSTNDQVVHECGLITTIESVYKISCHSKNGQKVRLKATNVTFISVCEVEVHQVMSSNVLSSRYKPTTQSSTLSNWHSNLAVDGIYSQDLNNGSCSRTNDELGFWMVDLQNEYRIYRVLIYNRQDCCADQMIGVTVELLSKSNELLHECSAITDVKSVYRVLCHSKKATKIRIRRLTKNFLTLCEVEVYRGMMAGID